MLKNSRNFLQSRRRLNKLKGSDFISILLDYLELVVKQEINYLNLIDIKSYYIKRCLVFKVLTPFILEIQYL